LSGAAQAERALLITQQAAALPTNPFAAFVTEASQRFAVPEHWKRASVHIESGGELRARSQKGAMGLMKIMPKTWTELRARYGLRADPYDPHDNIVASAAYIRELHDRYGSPGFLAAYNAGLSRYEKHLAMSRPLPDETQPYVATRAQMIEARRAHGKTVSPLFATRTENSPADGRPTHSMHPEYSLSVRTVVDLSALVPQSSNLFVRRASEIRSQ
jgi:soluble lytic murein transglycosylase-like protein